MKTREKQQAITALQNSDGQLLAGTSEMLSCAHDYYGKLFQAETIDPAAVNK